MVRPFHVFIHFWIIHVIFKRFTNISRNIHSLNFKCSEIVNTFSFVIGYQNDVNVAG